MILGGKVRFRLPESPSDHEFMVQWRNDPAIKPYFYNDEPVSVEGHMRWWAKVSADLSQRNYLIDACIEGQYVPIGMTALMNLDFINGTGEYARFKIDPAYQGRKFAFDAEMTLLNHAFNRLRLNKVWLHAFDDNEAVIKLHLKTGFSVEGTLRQHVFKDGRYRDIVSMAILAEEFHPKELGWPHTGSAEAAQVHGMPEYYNLG